MRLLLAFDKFKGSLSSQQVGEAFAAGWREVRPDDAVELLAIADGGDGTTAALVAGLGGEYRDVEVHDPLHRLVVARYGVVDGGASAVIECAAASGLARLTAAERDPLRASSYGTGELIADALVRGARRIYIGLGGSATNDGGVGMLRALGYRLYDAAGRELMGCGEELVRLAKIDGSQRMKELDAAEFIIASDVDNPLYGEHGAARVYAPQKGADEAAVQLLDEGLRNLAEVVERSEGLDFATCAGAGAAGGLGFAFMALLRATLRSGIDMVLDVLRFDSIVARCDLVLTGEGRIDCQTLMGKAPCGVLRRAARCNVPTIAVGGGVEWCDELRSSDFRAIYAATPEDMPLSEALHPDNAKANVRRIASHIAKGWR